MSQTHEYGWYDGLNGRNYLLIREGHEIGFRRDGDAKWEHPEDDFAVAREFERIVNEISRRYLANLGALD